MIRRHLLPNLGLLFVLYLPMTLLVGLLTRAYQAPGMGFAWAYEVFLWWVIWLQLLLPMLIAYLAALILSWWVAKWVAQPMVRWIAGTLVVGGLMGAQAIVWDGVAITWQWLVVSGLPGVLLAYVLRLPTSPPSKLGPKVEL